MSAKTVFLVLESKCRSLEPLPYLLESAPRRFVCRLTKPARRGAGLVGVAEQVSPIEGHLPGQRRPIGGSPIGLTSHEFA
jgi:hypothetical protein